MNEATALERVIAYLRDEAALAQSISNREATEDQRMYRIGQHDALLLASDEFARWSA